MSGNQTLLYGVSNGVANITFNRSKSRNALNGEYRLETVAAIQGASKDASVRVAVKRLRWRCAMLN